MKSLILASVAILSLGAGTAAPAFAQDASAPSSQPPGDAMTPPADPAAPPPSAGDPNAGQPTGAVPADAGMVPAPANAPRDPAAPVGSSTNPVTMGGNMTPPPTEAKDYPVCSKTVQDGCINRAEAKKTRKRH